MRLPQTPPSISDISSELKGENRLIELLSLPIPDLDKGYLHWDKLKHHPAPQGINHREWWLLVKLSRRKGLREVPLKDTKGSKFQFGLTEGIAEALHKIDLGAGGAVSFPEQITNRETRDRYVVRSLMEEAITSSQLEGAATTREAAKEMIRSGQKPRDISEQMILNNFITMERIRNFKDKELSPEVIFAIHRLVTEKTLQDETAAGRLRNTAEERVVGDDMGQVFHTPPPPEELQSRMTAMCDFANGKTPDFFVHPAIRAIILHFWLAYDHPFVDGNGRTARALFYWCLLRNNYWLIEFISISNIILKAPARYGRSFLYTETDANDLTYFIIAQVDVIRRAIVELHQYIEHKTSELKEAETQVRALDMFNHRQVALLRHALKHPGYIYTIKSHQKSHGVVYQTARTDLLSLIEQKVLEEGKRGREIIFRSPTDLMDRLTYMEQQ